jgi:hypothetical protein
MDLMEARRQSHELRKSGMHDVVIQNGGIRFDDPVDVTRNEIDLDKVLAQNQGSDGLPFSMPSTENTFPAAPDPDRPAPINPLPALAASTGRAIGGGVQDAVLGLAGLGEDIAGALETTAVGKGLGYIVPGLRNFNYSREQMPGGMRMDEAIDQGLQDIGLRIPEGDGTLENLARGLVQFGAGMAAAPVRGAGYLNMMLRGGFADALFDPEDGNISTLLRDLGLDNDVLEYLDSAVDEDADASERLKARLKNAFEGGIAGAAIDSIVVGFRIAKSNEGFRDAIREKLVGMGQSADARIEARDFKNTLSSGMDPTLITDPLISAAGRVAARTNNTGVRSEGGLPIVQEKGDENLRLHRKRLLAAVEEGKAYPGAPQNPRTVIKAPEGSNLPDIVVGAVEPGDWQTRIESSMSKEEIAKAADWYKVVFGEFKNQADGNPEEIARLTDAWFAGQQNSSPTQTLNDVLFVYEQIKRGVPKGELKGKGLPSANKIVIDILTDSTIEGGAGQKISDFLDSGYGKNVRAIMGNNPEGGSPFVVDIHTARDTGLVDQKFVNHLTRLGYDVPEGLILDVGGGGIKGPQYENRALFGLQLTENLNDQNWMGRSDWEPAEIQAIGWMQLSGMTGGSNTGGDVVDAFTRNTRRISMEVDPGAGSPWANKFGNDFGNLPLPARRAINDEVTAKAIDLVNKQTGITLGSNVHGTGGWELFQNPSTVQQAIASKDTAIEAGARLGYLLQQTEVWVNAPKAITQNPKNFSIDIVEFEGETLRDGDRLTELFDAIISEEPNELFRGYQPIVVDGKPGIRILITNDAVKASPLTKAQAVAYIQEFANGKLGEITGRLNFDAEVDIMEADLTQIRNDWTKDKTGGGYQSYFSGQSGKDASSEISIDGVLDTDGRELEELFERRIREAQENQGGSSSVDVDASSDGGG